MTYKDQLYMTKALQLARKGCYTTDPNPRVGCVLVSDDEVIFKINAMESYKLYHIPDCCEYVRVEDICGDVIDLVGSRILVAEEVNHRNCHTPDGCSLSEDDESFTWTFYKLDTAKGGITIRWLPLPGSIYLVKYCK